MHPDELSSPATLAVKREAWDCVDLACNAIDENKSRNKTDAMKGYEHSAQSLWRAVQLLHSA